MTGSPPVVKLTVQVSWPVPAMSVAQSVSGTHETDDPRRMTVVREMEVVKRRGVVDLELVGALRQGARRRAQSPFGSYMWICALSSTVPVSVGSGNASGHVPSGGSVELMRKTLSPLPWPMT